MKKIILVMSFLVVFACGTALAQGKVVFFEMEATVAASQAGAKFANELKTDFEKAQNKAKKLNDEITSISKELETQRSVLSQEAAQKKVADIQKKKIELERLEKDTNEDFQRRQMQFASVIVPELQTIIAAYSKEKGFEAVIDIKQSGTYYVDPKINITQELVKRLDESWSKKQK